MKHQYKLLSIMLACGLMTACSSDEPGLLSTPVPAQFSAQIGSAVSRASGTSWTSGDQIGISDNSGAFSNVPYATAGDGVFTPTGTDRFFYNSTDPVTFTAYYPFNADGGIITVSTADQSKQLEFDFLWTQATGNYADPDVRFNFRHCMSRLSLTFTNIGNVDLSDLKFTIGGLALEGTFDVATGEAAVSADAVAAELSITPSEATADRAASSVILFPQTPTDATITITAEGSEFISALPITELLPGTNYRLAVKVSATGIEVSEINSSEWTDGGTETVAVTKRYLPTELKPGDYLYSDGSWSDGGLRVWYADNVVEMAEEKPKPQPSKTVSGIVFWTPSETVTNGRNTPASLTDDKIMGYDFPNCTHGLAVAVKTVRHNGNDRIVWQPMKYREKVEQWQSSDNFVHEHKDDFVSISSDLYDPNSNKDRIFGYQNSVVLRAYNAYCAANGRSSYMVQPMVAIDEFAKSNPAPTQSTGWFLPSEKELYMLCSKDVDDIWNTCWEDPKIVTTRNLMNSSLAAISGDQLSYEFYWTSSESKDSFYAAFTVGFDIASVHTYEKFEVLKVRAVCAF